MIPLVVSLSILILAVVFHEMAHFALARVQGLVPEQFAIGFPIKPFYKGRFGATEFILSPWLIGGGVRLDPKKLDQLSYPRQFLIFVAGPAANFSLAMIAAALVLGPVDSVAVNQEMSSSTITAIGMIGSGDVELGQIGGPVALLRMTCQIISIDPHLGSLLVFVLINTSLGVMNLLPIPALDGGHIFIDGFRVLLGKKSRTGQALAYSHFFSFYLLFGVMGLLTVKDIFTH